AERLGQVIIGAALEADDLVRFLPARGQQQDRNIRIHAAVANGAAQRYAVEARQHDVEHEQIERLGLGQPQRLASVSTRLARIALEPEVQADEIANVRLVFDDEDAWSSRHT